jgi:aryl-alcohol dehydrogenase-like predicted oxidoreductase
MTQSSAWATDAGTAAYRARFEGKLPSAHFRRAQNLYLSSIGIGTYLGDQDAATDEVYQKGIVRAVGLGANVVDSAINYRFQRSERTVGKALKDLAAAGIARREIVVATKGGFIPFDGAPPADIRSYVIETFIKPGIAEPSQIISGSHCIAPAYLSHQLDCSLKNLDLDCIDIYYLHNPEYQLGAVPREEFRARLKLAFEALEGAVSTGKIRMYGTATWDGYRDESGARNYLSITEVIEIAQSAGGTDHHFKVIQLPLNLGMPEALTRRNQEVEGHQLSILQAAQAYGLVVMCSASILQGQLAGNLPTMISDAFPGFERDSQRALQFVRSTPGVTTALVGMKQIKHVEENLRTAEVPPAPWEQYSKLFETS